MSVTFGYEITDYPLNSEWNPQSLVSSYKKRKISEKENRSVLKDNS